MKLVSVMSLVLSMLFVVGCDTKPTHESITKDMLGQMKEMVEVLKGVKDEASAKAAKPKLEALKKEFDAMKDEADKMPAPSADVEKKMKEKFEPELEKLRNELVTEMTRIGSDPKLAAQLEGAMSM